MPFTPFHMGAAVLLKPALRTRFSFLVFGVSQVAIDIEPLVRMLRGDQLLHGWSHTLTGALLLGALAALVAKRPVNWWLAHLSRGAPPNARLVPVTWRVALLSAWIGTGSHLVLDGIMHDDIRPFMPIATTNPLLGLLSLGVLHIGLVAAGLLGLILMAVREKRSGAGD
jgi:membrane-bound metal-dependent hydrolase YbcI (DUF457 family)